CYCRRGKMQIFTILTLSLLLKEAVCINLTYIVKKEGEKLQPNCIADENERYAAVGWVYPLPEKEDNLPNITTKFIPTIRNGFDCKFSKNDKCNKIWALKNWEIDENSTRTLDLIFDSRWEDFPTISTGIGGKEFKDRVEIPNVFRAGFSLRASDGVELLICQGWNPYNYPCYHLAMGKREIILRKYTTLPKNISSSDKILDSYTAFANISSEDEWRNFIINLDDNGVLSLNDVNVNRTAIQYEDKEVLKPLYLLVRSDQPAVWKIHQNQFIYTKTAQTSRLGPILNLPSKDLCVALYVSTCSNCGMTFMMMKDNQRKILKDVEPTQEFEWRLIKLKAEHILSNKLNIFVETRFVNNSGNVTEGFWAVDDVRVCHENEVKITFLKLKEGDESAEDISCQVVQHPQWRPQKLVYSKIKDFPTIDITPNSTSISLNWTQEDPKNKINYFITYQANDLCLSEPFNLRRIKSNGFLMTKHNEITINNLIPYTKYNISFTSMLHENEMNKTVTTLETELPTPEELPNRIQIRTTATQAYVSWDKVDCTSIYGHILYSMQVINLDTNIIRELDVQTENTVEINDLQPHTPYTFNIITARSFENIQSKTNTIPMSYNLTTQAGTAPAVRNLELYSVDNNSASFRYDLPKKPGGIPAYIQATRCNLLTFTKCRSSVQKITRCKLWPKKYCLDINNLIPNQQYTFKISIKNNQTQYYGNETKADAFTSERTPGPPTNITYKIVDCEDALDYCHLNISWLHPYQQNGTITSFHIVLNGTDNNTTKVIQEVLTVNNKTYLPKYETQIKVIPYSAHYELYVQSANSQYKSGFSNIHVKTDDLGEHINQAPTLQESSPTSLTFKLPPLDRRLKSYTLTTIVQDFNINKEVASNVLKTRKVADNLCHNFGDTWVLPEIEISESNNLENVVIGSEVETNKYLEPNTQYCITFIVTNKYKNSEHDVVYYKKLKTSKGSTKSSDKADSSGSSHNHLYVLLLLLLLVPVGFLVYRYFKKRRPRAKQQENRENVYESLPFEECEDNSVNNETYDQLLHK
ncbi:uncharacterized protein BDFB_000742, partial [Asbolus verrucosus]